MTPLSLLAAQKLAAQLTNSDALSTQIAAMGAALTTSVPPIASDHVLLSSAGPDMDDRNIQLAYPRVCIYSTGVKNTQIEKFRSFSGHVDLVADIWTSADLLTQVDTWIHIYVECISELLRNNTGDWGNGFFYTGTYDVQLGAPKPGGLGFVQAAKLSISLGVSTA
jgi:hypothetical protein